MAGPCWSRMASSTSVARLALWRFLCSRSRQQLPHAAGAHCGVASDGTPLLESTVPSVSAVLPRPVPVVTGLHTIAVGSRTCSKTNGPLQI